MTKDEYKQKLGRYTPVDRLKFLYDSLRGIRTEVLYAIVGALVELEESKEKVVLTTGKKTGKK